MPVEEDQVRQCKALLVLYTQRGDMRIHGGRNRTGQVRIQFLSPYPWFELTRDPLHTSYDPASREILRKLDHVTTLLEDGWRGQVFTERNVDARGQEASPLSSITGRHNASGSLVDGVANAPDYPLRDQSRWSSSELPFSAVAYESFLRWPVFHNVMSEADQTIGSFLLESGHDHDPGNPSSRAIHGDTAHPNDASSDGPGSLDVARGVEEDDLIPLCTRFTRIVNVRNPVLDGAELLSYAKATAEHGLRYDGPSCLVVSQFFSQRAAGHSAEKEAPRKRTGLFGFFGFTTEARI